MNDLFLSYYNYFYEGLSDYEREFFDEVFEDIFWEPSQTVPKKHIPACTSEEYADQKDKINLSKWDCQYQDWLRELSQPEREWAGQQNRVGSFVSKVLVKNHEPDGREKIQNLWDASYSSSQLYTDGYLSFEEARGKEFWVPFYLCNNIGYSIYDVKTHQDFMQLNQAFRDPFRLERGKVSACLPREDSLGTNLPLEDERIEQEGLRGLIGKMSRKLSDVEEDAEEYPRDPGEAVSLIGKSFLFSLATIQGVGGSPLKIMAYLGDSIIENRLKAMMLGGADLSGYELEEDCEIEECDSDFEEEEIDEEGLGEDEDYDSSDIEEDYFEDYPEE